MKIIKPLFSLKVFLKEDREVYFMDSKLVVDKIDMLVTETEQGPHNQIEDTKKAPEHSQEQIKKREDFFVHGVFTA